MNRVLLCPREMKALEVVAWPEGGARVVLRRILSKGRLCKVT
jgi:hypothetical protein